ncbi:hypothetical protein PO909_032425 [Leuciscus waleckii]
MMNSSLINDLDIKILQANPTQDDLNHWAANEVKPDQAGILRDKQGRIALPVSTVVMLCRHYHGVSHVSKEKVIQNLNQSYCIANVRRNTLLILDACLVCARTNRHKAIAHDALPHPELPFQYLQIDFTHMPPCGNNKYLLVIIDRFSKWPEAFPCGKENAKTVVKVLAKEIIPRFGIPTVISSDNVQELCDEYCGLYSGKNCNRYVPSVKGTRALMDWFWLCGHMVYTSLPFNWSGRCALVTLEEYSMIIDNPVPKEHRLWTEVTRYELISFIKTTRDTLAGVQEELRSLRLTALQNRLVLDRLTAARGGVCVIVGISCCTFIPANDEDGHIIAEGIENMTKIANELQRREVSDRSGFSDWITSWRQMLVSALIPIGTILLILAFIVCCIIPALIYRAMNTFVSSQYAMMNKTVKP